MNDVNPDRATVNQRIFLTWDPLEDVLLDLDVPDDKVEQIENAIRGAVCVAIGGHDIIDDHCGKPEHRYCSTCLISVPNLVVVASTKDDTPDGF